GTPEFPRFFPLAVGATRAVTRALAQRDTATACTDAAAATRTATRAWAAPALARLDRRNELRDRCLAVAIKHARVVEVEQGVLDAGETRALTALDHDHVLGLVGIEDRHAVDGTGFVVALDRVDHVVG